MAGWNSDISVSKWLSMSSTFSLLIIYSIFIIRIALSLHRNNKTINSFLCVTLILIGLSIMFLQLQIILYLLILDMKDSLTLFYLCSDFAKSLERLGICVDIVRLRLILVSQDKDYQRKKRNTYIMFIIALIIMILFQVLTASFLLNYPYFLKYLQDHYPQDNAEMLLQEIFQMSQLVQTYVVDLTIICFYIAIFLIYRKRVQKITE